MVERVLPGLRAFFNGLWKNRGPWPLYLHGPPGVGKSCFGLCLADRVAGSVYTTPEEVVQRMQARPPLNFDCLTPRYCPLVILDELGTRTKTTDLLYEAVKGVLDARTHAPLVVISNLDPGAVGELFDARIRSRLMAGQVVALDGEDQRLKVL